MAILLGARPAAIHPSTGDHPPTVLADLNQLPNAPPYCHGLFLFRASAEKLRAHIRLLIPRLDRVTESCCQFVQVGDGPSGEHFRRVLHASGVDESTYRRLGNDTMRLGMTPEDATAAESDRIFALLEQLKLTISPAMLLMMVQLAVPDVIKFPFFDDGDPLDVGLFRVAIPRLVLLTLPSSVCDTEAKLPRFDDGLCELFSRAELDQLLMNLPDQTVPAFRAALERRYRDALSNLEIADSEPGLERRSRHLLEDFELAATIVSVMKHWRGDTHAKRPSLQRDVSRQIGVSESTLRRALRDRRRFPATAEVWSAAVKELRPRRRPQLPVVPFLDDRDASA